MQISRMYMTDKMEDSKLVVVFSKWDECKIGAT